MLWGFRLFAVGSVLNAASVSVTSDPESPLERFLCGFSSSSSAKCLLRFGVPAESRLKLPSGRSDPEKVSL